MDDMIVCRNCAKFTNKYAPTCLYCGTILVKEAPPPPDAPGKKDLQEEGSAMDRIAIPRLKKCPFCAEEIQYEAVKCKFCGELLKDEKKKHGHPGKSLFAPAISVILLLTAAVAAVWFLAGAARYDKGLNASGESYIKKFITLSGIGTLEDADPKSAAPTKYAYGTVKNNGERMISKIKIAVYYLNKKGKRVGDDSAWSVFGTSAKPVSLKPDSSKDFKILIADINPEWSGRIEARVIDIEFAD